MTRWQMARIALLLVVIFTGGFFAGRLSAPEPPASFAGRGGRDFTAEGILARFTMQLNLDPRQKEEFRPIVEETVEKMGELEPGAPERLVLFQEGMDRLRPLLRPRQQAMLDRLVQRNVRNFNRFQQRRAAAEAAAAENEGR